MWSGIRSNCNQLRRPARSRAKHGSCGTPHELQRRDLVKGYEFKKDHYLLLTDEDFDSVKVETSSVMMIEKFIDTDLIDPVYYDAAYFVVPDGDAGRDVYAVLREAVAKTGMTALARVVISQRERTIALRPMGDAGLMAHTLYEDRDLNSSKDRSTIWRASRQIREMVQLATQLVQRQAGQYDAADLEDRYETRLRAMIDAKLKGEGIDAEADAPAIATSNVIDLMAALRKSLGQTPAEQPAAPKRKKAADLRQTGLSCRSRAARSRRRQSRKPRPRRSSQCANGPDAE